MEWVVRGGVATADRLQKGYGAHIAVQGLFGFSVQYAPGQSWDDIAKARRFPHGQISIALDQDLQRALQHLGYTMQIVASPGRAYHHTFVVLYDASGFALQALPNVAALALEGVFRQVHNPYQGTPERKERQMQRISVDFNTLDSEPIDLVKMGQLGTPNGDSLPPLRPGERVLLYDEEMEVEAVAEYDAESRYWLAAPDWTTRRDLTPAQP